MNYLRKFLYVLPCESVALVKWFIAFTLVSMLEVFGIGIIGPFIVLASTPNLIQKNNLLNLAYTSLGFSEESKFIALIGLCIAVIFCIKSLISWHIQTNIFRFCYIQRKELLRRLMSAYLGAPYTFYTSKNSAQIIHNVSDSSIAFSDSILSTLLVSTSNAITIVFISLLLCYANPFTALSLLLISLPLILLFNSFKSKMAFWARELYESHWGIIRGINHGLGGFKENRVIGCSSFFEEQVVAEAQRHADSSIHFYAFKLSPRFVIETLLVVFLISFIVVNLILNRDVKDLTATLSIFALASIRLIPAFSGLANGLSTLKNSSFSLTELYTDLKELESIESSPKSDIQINSAVVKPKVPINIERGIAKIDFSHQLILDNVVYRYPNAAENALNRLSLTIKKGQSIALIGKSGAGKTTLVDVILGLLTAQKGDITVDGISIYTNLRSWQNLIGYIPQSIFLIDDTIERNIAFGVPDHLIDQQKLDRAIQLAQISEMVESLPDGVDTRIGERGVMLSGGQRQRVGIARALYHEREILVLDEATSALDNETEHLVTDAIKALIGTKTMITIAHRLTTVKHCDQIYLLEKGQIIKSGTYKEVVLEK